MSQGEKESNTVSWNNKNILKWPAQEREKVQTSTSTRRNSGSRRKMLSGWVLVPATFRTRSKTQNGMLEAIDKNVISLP